MVRPATVVILTVLVAAAAACRASEAPGPDTEGSIMDFAVSSSAFDAGARIPSRYTCDADDLSPELRWGEPPEGTKSFAVICDDPDAPVGTWVHWVIWNLPSEARGLPEAIPAEETLPDGTRQGVNDFRRIGYGGPCPPPGKAHRYFFRFYALDAPLDLAPGADRKRLEAAMKGHVVGQSELVGTYGR